MKAPPTRKGNFLTAVVDAYIAADKEEDKSKAPAAFKVEDVDYAIRGLDGTTTSSGNSCATATGGCGECLYMDVGCWTGPRPDPGANRPQHKFHREFGVVCGKLAVLCRYLASPAGSLKVDDREVSSQAGDLALYRKQIKPLLDHLSSTQRPAGLGEVQVIKALTCDGTRAPVKDSDRIYVFLGDLHLPVLTDPRRSLFLKPGEPVPTRADDTVHRAWRYDPTDPKIAQLMKEISDLLALVRKAVEHEQLLVGYGAIVAAGMILTLPAHAPVSVPTGLPVGKAVYDHVNKLYERVAALATMLRVKGLGEGPSLLLHEAQRWFDAYHGTASRKGADIFSGAADDLVTWLDLLASSPAATARQLTLTQVGDMYDLWIGLGCGWQREGEGKTAVVRPVRDALAFRQFWKGLTAEDPSNARVIAAFKRVRENRVQVYLLRGNHDNYLDGGVDVKLDGACVWVEHGHQMDTFNWDQDPLMGWAITQIAFMDPSVRDIEGPLTSILAKYSPGDIGARLRYLARAADVCREEGCATYVMGHTHEALLRRIRFKSAELSRDPPVNAANRNVL